MLSYRGDRFSLAGSFNDGREAEKTRFEEDDVDYAFTGRGEILLAGEWDQVRDDSQSWSDEGTGAMIGTGAHYQAGTTGTPAPNNNFLLWTLDGSFESGGFGALLAGYGHHQINDVGQDFTDFGLLAEAGYMVVPDTIEPFARYEMILQDDQRPNVINGDTEEQTNIVTAGVNWYQAKHDSKVTVDLVYALDPLNDPVGGPDGDEVASGSLGLRNDAGGEDGQVALRAQYQLKW